MSNDSRFIAPQQGRPDGHVTGPAARARRACAGSHRGIPHLPCCPSGSTCCSTAWCAFHRSCRHASPSRCWSWPSCFSPLIVTVYFLAYGSAPSATVLSSAAISALVQPWTTWSKVGPMSPSVVQGRPFCGGLEWSKANFGRAGPGPRWDLAWRSANLEKFRLRRSFARGPAPSTPVLEESLDFEARRGKKEGFFYPHFIWSYVVQCWSYVASPTPSKMVQCASKCEIAALTLPWRCCWRAVAVPWRSGQQLPCAGRRVLPGATARELCALLGWSTAPPS